MLAQPIGDSRSVLDYVLGTAQGNVTAIGYPRTNPFDGSKPQKDKVV